MLVRHRIRPVAVAVLTGVVLVGFRSAASAEISVKADGTGDYVTIQDAVNAAAPLDEIVLEDGVFLGAGNRDIQFFGKDLVVRSRNGAAAVTIDTQGSSGDPHRAFRLGAGETSASRIDGLTITGGFVEGPFPESGGGGILVEYGTHPVIENCIFDGNEAGFQGFGAGLLAWEDCDITLRDCTFINGTSGWYGGGFVLRKFCDALVERVNVISNYALHAGGGASITNSDVILNDCVFIDNETTEVDGGGLLVKAGATPVLTRCIFYGNRAFVGGAIGLGNEPDVTLVDCYLARNSAQLHGGAICVDQEPSTLRIMNCTLVDNRAGNFGGHIISGNNSTTIIRNSILGPYCDALSAVWVTNTGSIDIDCSVVLGGAVEIAGTGTIGYGAENVDADPLFCAAEPAGCAAAASPVGDYSVDSMSPAAASWHSCGRVGAYDVGCGATSSPDVETLPWSRVKSRYR